METDAKAKINNASLIDLKAELFRKQEEFKQQKNVSGSFVKGRIQEKSKPDLFSRKNKGVLERAQRDYEEKVEEEDVHAKSWRALEAKAKLYEKISSSSEIPEEDGSGLYLVDFQKKVIDNIVETRDRERKEGNQPVADSQDTHDESLSEDVPPPSDPQEEWVDYVDSLGRSRRCMKKDLPKLMKQDKEMAKVRGEVSRPVKPHTVADDGDTPTLMSDDMHRELLRQKWEKEEQEALNNTNIHYANVQFDEIRTHGVGFYQFDKSDQKRQEQMDTLNKLREQTVDERGRRERLKEKRKAMLDTRLAKVKQRRKLKEGVVLADNQEQEDEEIGPTLEEMLTGKRGVDKKSETSNEKKDVKPLIRDDNWRKDAPVREWDKGKEKTAVFSQERYMSERRDERQSEFAPPAGYFHSLPSKPITKNLPDNIRSFGKVSFNSKQDVKFSVSESKTEKVEDVDVGSIPLPTDTRQEREGKVQDSQKDINLEPPNLSQPAYQSVPFVPLPNMSVPPPGYQPVNQWTQPVASAPVYPSYPIQNYTAGSGPMPQLPDTSVPPPGLPPVQHTAASSSGGAALPAVHSAVPNQTSHTQTSHTVTSYEAKPAVYVPRASVLDTRLVQNVDSDIPSAAGTDVPEVQAEPYKPGSFTAALQAEHQAREEVATASRDRAHFKGGPVVYKHEPGEANSVPEPKSETQSDSVLQQNTEDELTAFLKEIRESV